MSPTVYSPPVPTYTALQTIELTGTASTVTFSSIPASYRDLVVVMSVKKTSTGDANLGMRFNADSGNNYSVVAMLGAASATSFSTADDKVWAGELDSSNFYVNICQIMDYSATDKHKTVLTRGQRGSRVDAAASRWANTDAITSVLVYPTLNSFEIGSTISLFGVEA